MFPRSRRSNRIPEVPFGRHRSPHLIDRFRQYAPPPIISGFCPPGPASDIGNFVICAHAERRSQCFEVSRYSVIAACARMIHTVVRSAYYFNFRSYRLFTNGVAKSTTLSNFITIFNQLCRKYIWRKFLRKFHTTTLHRITPTLQHMANNGTCEPFIVTGWN